ncbi:peptidase associated/transthyretin-like domain-containing protein [Marinobacter bohaiensis]|uniref:protocatechuate dioxygenase n=1 Tax=Marinobacter bohaiensis TaxID=2201898 RepID=UPI000DAE4097|nr:protocatechuate dioxygenase [Marinobacter bohaiensis]
MSKQRSWSAPFSRRRMLALLGAVGATPLTGWRRAFAADPGEAGRCVLIPRETAGPFPLSAELDNDALTRSDITEGRPGIPLELTFTLLDIHHVCQPISGNASVYVWHCDRDGVYSGYGSATGQTFMRGLQPVDEHGRVRFETVYPGWYRGRITHIHFQVFLHGDTTATSQLVFPDAVTRAVYHSPLYPRGPNRSVATVDADFLFRDGAPHQTASISGSVAEGFRASLEVGIDLG